MTCSEFLAILDDVLDGKVDAAIRADLEKHLYRCTDCEVVLNTTRKTIEVYKCNQVYEMPEELRTKLHERILAKCKEVDGPCSKKKDESAKAAEI